jgi:4-hydroxy-3-polyprenylbenzoate decarboxylase
VKIITVAITGASGAIYAQRLLWHMERSDEVSRVHLVVSSPGRRVLAEELDVTGPSEALVEALVGRASDKIDVVPSNDIGAKIASGSYPVDGMAIVPCSVSTVGALASGAVTNLVHRAADVMLKESRRLVVVPRETPLHAIHLENLLRLRNAGAMIVPAMPGFYHRPQTIEQLVDHFVFRLFDHLGLSHARATMWQGGKGRGSGAAGQSEEKANHDA